MAQTTAPYPPPVPRTAPVGDADVDAVGDRLSPQQLLLGVGAVLVVAAGAASLATTGDTVGQLVLGTLAVTATVLSVLAARRPLRATEETLAAAALVLAALLVRALDLPGSSGGVGPGVSALGYLVLAGGFLALSRVVRTTHTWPLAAWTAVQLAAASWLSGSSLVAPVPTSVLLATAIVGLGTAVTVRSQVAVLTLVSALVWWVFGAFSGLRVAWDVGGLPSAVAATTLVAAGLALAATEYRPQLRPWIGPRLVVPLVAGGVMGLGIGGALRTIGPVGVQWAGHAGLLLAVGVAAVASRRTISVFRPLGLTTATTLTAMSVVEQLFDGRWSALSLLLLMAAAVAALVAVRQPVDRPGSLPVVVGCLAGAVALQSAAGTLPVPVASAMIVVIALGALVGTFLARDLDEEHPLALAAGTTAVAALLMATGAGAWGWLAAELVVWGLAVIVFGEATEDSTARWSGVAAVVGGCWTGAATGGVDLLEAYTLPLAIGLLAGWGRQLATGPSRPTFGPGLLTAAAPSVTAAVLAPSLTRLMLVIVIATVVMAAAARLGVRAPFEVAGASLTVLSLGLLVRALPWPALIGLAVAGALLIFVGAGYEERRMQLRSLAARLSQMR
jgi:hypothetical protein